jgi:hypothetical protein
MVIVAIKSLELEYLVKILDEVGAGIRTVLPTLTPPKIPFDSDSTALPLTQHQS